jgi:hypothetical protein
MTISGRQQLPQASVSRSRIHNCELRAANPVPNPKNPALFLDQFDRRLPAHNLPRFGSTRGFARSDC